MEIGIKPSHPLCLGRHAGEMAKDMHVNEEKSIDVTFIITISIRIGDTKI